MNWVSGSAIMREPAICSSDSGVRRQAFGLSEPLRNALAAIVDSTPGSMSWSAR